MDKYINGLRIIETARNLDKINSAIGDGYSVIIKEVVPLSSIVVTFYFYQHKKTKKIIKEVVARRIKRNDEYKLLKQIEYYPHKFENPYAAYLIPPDIQLNEKVFIADLIEDFLRQLGSGERLKSCEAIWNGQQLEILYTKDMILHRGLG